MSVIIGIDPHKALHAACAIDRHREPSWPSCRSAPGRASSTELLAWAAPFECRTWAIESAGGLGYLLAQQLVARGEHVVDVPATLSSRVRVLGSGRSNKNDANDARAVAVAALRSPSLAVGARRGSRRRCCACWPKPSSTSATRRSRACSRLHALVRELVPGGIRKEIVVTQAEQLLAAIEPVTATQRQRLELAHETLDEIRVLDAKLKRSKAPHHRRRHRVGDDADRDLRSRPDHRRDRHRLHRRHRPVPDRRALRRVQRHRTDRVLLVRAHRAPAVATRQPDVEPRDPHDRRHPDPPRPTAKAAPTTTASSPRAAPRREAMRALKRHISDRVYRHLRADARAK